MNIDFDDHKRIWQNGDPDPSWERTNLQAYWSHPNLRSLRRQLIFETICWALFLSVYYNAFDGHLRSNGWNIALVIGLVALIAHGIAGYRLASMPVGDAPLRIALENQLNTLKRFRWISIFLRTTGLVIFFGFMVSNVPFFGEASKLWLIGTVIIWIAMAVAINYFIWKRHFNRLEETLAEFGE